MVVMQDYNKHQTKALETPNILIASLWDKNTAGGSYAGYSYLWIQNCSQQIWWRRRWAENN